MTRPGRRVGDRGGALRATSVMLVGAAPLLAAACASAGTGLSAEPSAYGAASARSAAVTFLDAARERDYGAMGRLFGTRDGPAERRLGVAEIEQRMIVLAGLLRHEDATLRREDLAQLGPNRARFVAALTGTLHGRAHVPVVTVSTPERRWFVERIGVEELSRSGG